jgi:hypothetical protein
VTKFSNINRDNLKWLGRLALIFVLVGLADGLVVGFARKPFPWVVIIPAATPLLTAIFVIIPCTRAHKTDAPGA